MRKTRSYLPDLLGYSSSRVVVAVIVSLALIGSASAAHIWLWSNGGHIFRSGGGGGGPPPSGCTQGAFKFNQTCNAVFAGH